MCCNVLTRSGGSRSSLPLSWASSGTSLRGGGRGGLEPPAAQGDEGLAPSLDGPPTESSEQAFRKGPRVGEGSEGVSQRTHIDINPDRLAALSLCRAANAVEQAAADPRTWFFIILDLNRALYAALVAALSASAFDEVYSPKLRMQWSEFWEKSRTDPNARPPTGNFVPELKGVLAMAEAGSLSMQPLHLSQEQRADIMKLNEYRGNLEHVKPENSALDSTDLPRIAKNAAGVFEVLFEAFKHHLEVDEIERAYCALGKLGWRP